MSIWCSSHSARCHQGKLEVRNNFLIATILSFPTPIRWNRSAFGTLGNPSNALDIGGCLLGMAFTIGPIKVVINDGHGDKDVV
jgi:hypothetical protein